MKQFPLLVAAMLAAAVSASAAEPVKIPAEGGKFTLPLSGLAVVFPAESGTQRELKGSWSLRNGYDARDVIDEFKDGQLAAGTWVQTGYFNAGGPRATIETIKLTDSWPATTMEAWGLTWQVRGGQYTFMNSLGKQPVIVLAADRGESQPTLLIDHYFIGEENLPEDEMIRRVKESDLIAAVVKAYRQLRWSASRPMHHPAVTHRDDSAAARTVTLPKNGLTVQLPADGFFWKPEERPEDTTDLLYRLGPTFPELMLDILVVNAASVEAGWKSIGLAPPSGVTIANLPDGWVVGPEVTPSAGKESTIAKLVGGKVLIVGFIADTATTDTEAYGPVLEALADAVVKRP